MSLHFLVLGRTGVCGVLFINAALADGHNLTNYARNPSKVPGEISTDSKVEVVQGELENSEALERAAKSGADVFVSCVGPYRGAQGTVCYAKSMPMLSANGTKRALVLCTPSFSCSHDSRSLLWSFGTTFTRFSSQSQYKEVIQAGKMITTQSPADIDWTLFRVGGLTDEPAKEVRAIYPGSVEDMTCISRASVANWVLGESKVGKRKGEAPYICNIN